MKNLFNYYLIGSFLCAVWACSDKDTPAPVVGITEVSVTPDGSAVASECVVDQQSLTIENRVDSIAWDVSDAALANAKIKVTTTLGVTVSYNGTDITSVGLDVDVTQPIDLVAKDGSTSKTYRLKVVRAKTAKGENMVLKSSDMRANGINSKIYDFDVAYFDGKFYAITSSLDGDLASYQLYSSDNGIKWTEIKYTLANTVNDSKTVGGQGARLCVYNNRLYVLGGARVLGTADQFGETSEFNPGFFGTPDTPVIKYWRSASTADGQSFRVDTIGVKYDIVKNFFNEDILEYRIPLASNYADGVFVFKNEMYYRGGFNAMMGMWQVKGNYRVTTDGINWVKKETNPKDISSGLGNALFVFKNKLWSIGGTTKNRPSLESMRTEIYSSTDGVTWTKEADNAAFGKIWGMKVVATDDVAYAFGGEFFDEGATGDGLAAPHSISKKIYRSTDGINWTEVETPPTWTARRNPVVVVNGNTAWIFGGVKTPTSDGMAYPYDNTADLLFETWVKLLK